jgi:hypothetical protein
VGLTEVSWLQTGGPGSEIVMANWKAWQFVALHSD